MADQINTEEERNCEGEAKVTDSTIIPERMQRIQALPLQHGNHEENEREMCVMEAVAYVAGEPWSDAPQCACPVITAFMVSEPIAVRFKSKGRSGREWVEHFDLGDAMSNGRKALEVAWKKNASIVVEAA